MLIYHQRLPIKVFFIHCGCSASQPTTHHWTDRHTFTNKALSAGQLLKMLLFLVDNWYHFKNSAAFLIHSSCLAHTYNYFLLDVKVLRVFFIFLKHFLDYHTGVRASVKTKDVIFCFRLYYKNASKILIHFRMLQINSISETEIIIHYIFVVHDKMGHHVFFL